MGDWYLIGLAAGLGVSLGVLAVGLLAALRGGGIAAGVVAAVLAAGIGLALGEWDEALAGAIGAVAGVLGSAQLVSGALRRGGTRGGTASLVALLALALAGLAFVPVAGYLEVVALPALAVRLRRRMPERYAGLRTLAK